MHKIRIIARLDIKNEYVIKGIHLEGLRKIGNPNVLAKKYYDEGIDEIIFMDAVASLYGRNNLFHIIEKACQEIFIPITIGGGIRSVQDIELALKSGADKITLNTQAIKNPSIIREASRVYGSQCIVGSIEAKKNGASWEAYIDNGRERTGIDAIEWAVKLEDLGIGELCVTSIDKEGTKKGFDIDLMNAICNKVNVPVIASGGANNSEDIIKLCTNNTGVNAVALASMLHYNLEPLKDARQKLLQHNILSRN
ncbi:MAG: imidazole glycerol phosphate synthase cyclase subunit [Bacteroidota bacterium]|nr:imidazole glycerol phosphate synthase cyclase subunit [Bacteroidota bacterium]